MENTNIQKEKPRKTYWFKRQSDGLIWGAHEEEASEVYYSSNRNRQQKADYLGVSDGTTYFNYIKNSKGVENDIMKKIEEKQSEVEQYLITQNKFKFEDLLDDDDPKMVKLEGILDKLNEEIQALKAERNEIRLNVVSKAQEAELAVANKNELPPDRTYRDLSGKITNPNAPSRI